MKYHSTKSKRSIMQKLGLAKAGRDLDEVAGLAQAEWKRSWWVKQVDQPTAEVDWDVMQRYDSRYVPQVYYANYVGQDVADKLNKLSNDRRNEYILQNKPGYTLRDRALEIGANRGTTAPVFIPDYSSPAQFSNRASKIFTADDIGVPRWEGTPEENARMIRSAAIYYGAGQVGFVELDEKTRKLIYSFDADGKKIEFEDVDLAYETEDKRVIPNKARWVIVFSVQMSEELLKRRDGLFSTALSGTPNSMGYSQGRNVLDRLQTFLHVLGYQGLGSPWFNGLGIGPALGIMAGLGEQSRLNVMISPEFGPMQRIFRLVTDLPLAPTGPIDAGIMRFCRTCKKCATLCPSKTLSEADDPSWETSGTWSNPGHKAYHYIDSAKCMTQWKVSSAGCSTCLSVCPFAKKHKSFIHTVVESTIAKVPMFNGIFTKMDELLGYDKPKDNELWWDLDMPPHGMDSTHGTELD
ncbi:MAG: reductive dehalogenase [Chloroflexi bacterium]|jgi:epoxyqueuosine reductase|nr:reductive dehalogenase [Chloroflexota bacterium]MBT7081309.1 reductive dehalogenase [Chloroflexota bacterium]MBT7290404.1 reductive dehalogenase [Chloroflexota bacterium]